MQPTAQTNRTKHRTRKGSTTIAVGETYGIRITKTHGTRKGSTTITVGSSYEKKTQMGTYRQIFYQIIFGTKHRESAINEKNELELYKYIWGILKNKKCKLYRINGMPDHIHIFCDLHPSISLSSLVKDIKVASNLWIKESGLFPEFVGWQEGYGAFTCSIREKEMIMNYIKNQKEHHRKETFEDEFKRLLGEQGIEFDERE